MNYLFFIFLFSFTNQEFILTKINYFEYIHCKNNFYIKINSIKYFYNQYNYTIIIQYNDINQCLNKSSCFLNLKPFLSSHIIECRQIKLKTIRLNYTCIKENNSIEQRQNDIKNTLILCLCIIIFISLFALICSYFRHYSSNDTHHILIHHENKQEYELKNLLIVESSSTSTLTSLNNKNIITNLSEYDNFN